MKNRSAQWLEACLVSSPAARRAGKGIQPRGANLAGFLPLRCAPAGNDKPHIRKTPNRVSSTGALRQAENASASTRRVSEGRIMPSSQSRAVA